MWIPSHVGLENNEFVDERARHAALKCLAILVLREWQRNWHATDNGRLAHSILPRVSLRPWFEGQKEDRKFVSSVSRILSDHCAARSHFE
jgi:hypothetical protein